MSEKTDENNDTDARRHEAGNARAGSADDTASKDGGEPEHSIRPGVPVPDTIFIAVMNGNSYLLQGWPDGANAYLCAEDAGLLRQALAAAFGSELACGTAVDTFVARS